MKTIVIFTNVLFYMLFSSSAFSATGPCLDGELNEYDVYRDGLIFYSIKIDEGCVEQLIEKSAIVLDISLNHLYENNEFSDILGDGRFLGSRLKLHSIPSNEFRASLETLMIERSADAVVEISIGNMRYMRAEYGTENINFAPIPNSNFVVRCSKVSLYDIACSLSASVSRSNIQYRYSILGVTDPDSFDWMALYTRLEDFVESILITGSLDTDIE